MSYRKPILAFITILFFPMSALAESAWYDNITLESGLTVVVQNSIGNEYGDSSAAVPEGEVSTATKDQADYAFTADIMLTGKLSENEELVFHLEAGGGHSMSDNVPSRTAINYDPYDTQVDGQVKLNVSQAYYQRTMADKKFSFAVGLMDAHSLTDSNEFAGDETAQFLNGVFVRSTGVVFHESTYYYAPTVYLEARPASFLSLVLTYSNPEGNDILDQSEVAVQLGLHPSINERQGNYRFGYIIHSQGFTKIVDGTEASNTGFFISVDQQLTDLIGLFFRMAQQDDSLNENEVLVATSFGLSLNGFMDNEGNGFGLGYAFVEFNPNLVSEFDEGEDIIEAYIRFGTSDNTQLTVDFQYINNLQRDDKRSVMVGGVRFQMGL
ncbi:MAG: carbohydrate porin [Nitrospinota bacterium]|nr:carbohydrate porin [Nitrospinota bacterium]